MARGCRPAAALPGAAVCDGVFVFVSRWASEPSGVAFGRIFKVKCALTEQEVQLLQKRREFSAAQASD